MQKFNENRVYLPTNHQPSSSLRSLSVMRRRRRICADSDNTSVRYPLSAAAQLLPAASDQSAVILRVPPKLLSGIVKIHRDQW